MRPILTASPGVPYNAAPDALLLNYKAVAMGFTPDTAAGVAHVRYEPPLARLQLPASVPLAPAGTACGDWRMGLQAELTHAERIAFQGAYPAACGAREWSVAPSDPSGYAARAVEGMWRELGGRLAGRVRRDGQVPAGLPAGVQRPITAAGRGGARHQQAQQQRHDPAAAAHAGAAKGPARAALMPRVACSRNGGRSAWDQADPPDGGQRRRPEPRRAPEPAAAGAHAAQAWASPVMPEFMASLPIVGMDGTLRRQPALTAGAAHLKSGSLRDVTGPGRICRWPPAVSAMCWWPW